MPLDINCCGLLSYKVSMSAKGRQHCYPNDVPILIANVWYLISQRKTLQASLDATVMEQFCRCVSRSLIIFRTHNLNRL